MMKSKTKHINAATKALTAVALANALAEIDPGIAVSMIEGTIAPKQAAAGTKITINQMNVWIALARFLGPCILVDIQPGILTSFRKDFLISMGHPGLIYFRYTGCRKARPNGESGGR
jgi:hypothetical protein